LKKLAAGTHAHVDSKSNAAWNFQYEMFLAAVMQRSGYDIMIAEPDVVIKDAGRMIGIAAKRPQSAASVVRNVKKAADQIRNTRLSGLIALDLSLIAGGGVLFVDTEGGARLGVAIAVNKFLHDHQAEIERACQGKHVIGCLVTLNLPSLIRVERGGYKTATAVRWIIIDLSNDFSTSEWLRRFAQKCGHGLFGDPEI
jgi:hypothetical protein